MIEKTFLDRVPTYPGRVKMMPVSGQANTYDMVRADSPTVEGTPIDKATFDSITQSRLTGRYYRPTVQAVQGPTEHNLTVNPLPQSWENVTLTSAQSGDYRIISTGSINASYTPNFAFDGDSATEWTSPSMSQPYIGFYSAEPITVRVVRLALHSQRYNSVMWHIEGSNNGATWSVLHTFSAGETSQPAIYSITNPGAYNYYRLRLDSSGGQQTVGVAAFEIVSYSIRDKANAFAVAEGFPAEWTQWQRVTIVTPTDFSATGVTSNTINGIPLDHILMPYHYYELIYNGEGFWVWGL